MESDELLAQKNLRTEVIQLEDILAQGSKEDEMLKIKFANTPTTTAGGRKTVTPIFTPSPPTPPDLPAAADSLLAGQDSVPPMQGSQGGNHVQEGADAAQQNAAPIQPSISSPTPPVSQLSQEQPVNLADLPPYYIVRRQHVPTITHIPFKKATKDVKKMSLLPDINETYTKETPDKGILKAVKKKIRWDLEETRLVEICYATRFL